MAQRHATIPEERNPHPRRGENPLLLAMSEQAVITALVYVNYMELSPPWKDNSSSASQEIPRIWRNPKVRYHVPNSLSPDTMLIHVNLVHTSSPTILLL